LVSERTTVGLAKDFRLRPFFDATCLDLAFLVSELCLLLLLLVAFFMK